MGDAKAVNCIVETVDLDEECKEEAQKDYKESENVSLVVVKKEIDNDEIITVKSRAEGEIIKRTQERKVQTPCNVFSIQGQFLRQSVIVDLKRRR